MVRDRPTELQGEPKQDLWLPLNCPTCMRSAYEVNQPHLQSAESIMPEIFRKTDPGALDMKLNMIVDCPYCGFPLGAPFIYPRMGGGFQVRFRWIIDGAATE